MSVILAEPAADRERYTYADYCRLPEGSPYQPDIIFIANERMAIIEEKRINGAPDLVVEILSPGTGYYDLFTCRLHATR